MAARLTQEGVEVLVTPDSSVRRARVTQLGAEAVVNSALRRARVTQFGVELLLPNEAITPVPTGALAQRWTGSAWQTATAQRWTGSAWVPATVKRWDGTGWV